MRLSHYSSYKIWLNTQNMFFFQNIKSSFFDSKQKPWTKINPYIIYTVLMVSNDVIKLFN